MLMPYTRNWLHLIWSTKNRQPLLAKSFRQKAFYHMRENAQSKGFYIDHINGTANHVHLLISLPAKVSLSDWVRLVKGESSNWINKQDFIKIRFGWQEEYIGISYNESDLNIVREYIRNQEEHHKLQSFEEEYQLLLEKYGFLV
ncbi:MAG: IS200/IS605 family transposase [Lentisphaeria bacterium]|nr:IS200/IS605 family transposase [Candidatus Neomarinimicrobiota bacterium]MCF7841464.1 IS200/IS605 family transposase [Lentisphaeria bacterium]